MSPVADVSYMATGVTTVMVAGGAAVGWLGNRTPEIAGSWRDGVEALGVYRDALRGLCAAVGPAGVAAVLWLLAVVLPAHGTHRAGVAR